VEVVLIDRNNYHLFTPLLFEVASALLDPSEIAQPVRKLVRPLHNSEFRLGEVRALDLDGRRVLTDRGELAYDYLVVAGGSANNYFGNRSVERLALSLKELPAAIALRNRVIELFERARWITSSEERRTLLTFVVVGGGPTGVEYAGALSELIRLVLRKDYPGFDLAETRVLLLEGSDRLLGTFHPSLSAAALRSLEHKHVEVWLRALVSEVRPDQVTLSDGRSIAAGSVIWTAGVRGSDVGGMLGVERDRQGRVPVRPTLQLEGRHEVFVIGDLAGLDRLPMLAQVAMQEAKHAARVIEAELRGRQPKPFKYFDPGIMATIGRNSAVAQFGPLRLSGFVGWVMWLAVHLVNIVTFRARFFVLVSWAYDYLLYDRPVRLMVRADPPPGEGP
jgi:NADH dehydrogenase